MKLRLIPVAMTVVISSVVLFGGWSAYQSFAMEDPFVQQISEIEGVSDSAVELVRDRAAVKVTLSEEAKLRESYSAILEAARSSLGKRAVEVEAEGENGSSAALDDWWSAALFDVAQAMETRQYAMIPKRLAELAEGQSGLQVATEMDEANVYITLRSGEHSKYVVLPRTPAAIGVWPNE